MKKKFLALAMSLTLLLYPAADVVYAAEGGTAEAETAAYTADPERAEVLGDIGVLPVLTEEVMGNSAEKGTAEAEALEAADEADKKPAAEEAADTDGEAADTEQSEEESVEAGKDASEDGIVDSGTCGANLTWTFSEDGTLTISGEGEMITVDENGYQTIPWLQYSEEILRVVIEDGVTTIADDAFWGYSNLTEAVIADGVTSIGRYAFCGCISLAEVRIPDSVVEVGGKAFDGTPWKETVTAGQDFFIINHTLVEYLGDDAVVAVPDDIVTISYGAFRSNEQIKQVVLPDSVSSMGDSVFMSCTNLTNVNIPDHLTTIQYSTFSGCLSLTEVEIPETVTSIKGYAFYRTGLTSITVPESVAEIEEYAMGYTGEEGSFERYPVEDFTIYGYPGSAAETYAGDNVINFVSLAGSESGELTIVPDKTDDTYIRYSGKDVVIYCTGELNKFVSVEMDGVVVDPANYTVEDGSTVLTFASSYLDTLSTGRHTVTLNYIDGSISTYLMILDEDGPGGTSGTGNGSGLSGTGNGTGAAGNGSSNGNGTAGSGSSNGTVKTGDSENAGLWVLLVFGSAVVCFGMALKRAKRIS